MKLLLVALLAMFGSSIANAGTHADRERIAREKQKSYDERHAKIDARHAAEKAKRDARSADRARRDSDRSSGGGSTRYVERSEPVRPLTAAERRQLAEKRARHREEALRKMNARMERRGGRRIGHKPSRR